jgi:hypothetical protein
MIRWFYISLSYATYGIRSTNDIVDIAAPIASWMIGKKLSEIKPFLLKNKAKVFEIK